MRCGLSQTVDGITEAISVWLTGNFKNVAVFLAGAHSNTTEAAVVLDLVSIDLDLATSQSNLKTVLRLEYFISVMATDTLTVHKLLGEIAFALADKPFLQPADADPVAIYWAKNTAGRLGIILSASLPRLKSKKAAPPVLHPPVITIAEMASIEGTVKGPDGIAVAGAVVEIPSRQLRQVTQADGRFYFQTPLNSAKSVRLIARKQQFQQSVIAEAGQHLTLQLSVEG
jgi:hypothetical protein